MSNPQDTRGTPISLGDWVVYATNDRDSGLQFGHVHKILEKDVKRWALDSFGERIQVPAKEYRIQLLKTDAHGNPVYETEYDPYAPPAYPGGRGAHVPTDKQRKSGFVQVYSGKFLVL